MSHGTVPARSIMNTIETKKTGPLLSTARREGGPIDQNR